MSDDIDLLGGDEEAGGGFPVHQIKVWRVRYDVPGDQFGIDPSELGYEIDHGTCEWRGEECLVESTVNDLGLHAAMFGVWSKGENGERLEETVYRVRGWASMSPDTPNGPAEYDAGIEIVDADDPEWAQQWPEGTEIPFRSDGQFGLPEEGVMVIRHMPKMEQVEIPDDDADE